MKPKTTKKPAAKNGASKYVLLRTTGAGVHFGCLVSRDGGEVTLSDARRLWRWKGANTLHEIALRGVSDDYTRISEPLAEAVVLGVHEVLTLTEEARANLTRSRWGT